MSRALELSEELGRAAVVLEQCRQALEDAVGAMAKAREVANACADRHADALARFDALREEARAALEARS